MAGLGASLLVEWHLFRLEARRRNTSSRSPDGGKYFPWYLYGASAPAVLISNATKGPSLGSGRGFVLFMKTMKIDKNLFLNIFAAILAVVPVSIFLIDYKSGFSVDWYNHIWIIGYFSNFLMSNGYFPLTMNTAEFVLMPHTLFYGFLFYPMMSVISLLTGPNLSVRLLCVLLFFFQYYYCNRLIREICGNVKIAAILSILLTWSIYPLTNIYHRSAVTEFVATTFAFMAFSLLFIIMIDGYRGKRKILDIYVFLVLVLCILGTHPITFVFTGLFFLYLCGVFILYIRILLSNKINIIIFVVFTISVLLVASPWIYVVTQNDATIKSFDRVILYPKSIDTLKNRFFPVLNPIDVRVEQSGISSVPTPYLDTQCNILIIILIVLFIAFQCFERRRDSSMSHMQFCISTTLLISMFIFVSILSLNAKIFDYLPNFMRSVQFCYRMVTYQNLLIMTISCVVLMHYEIREAKGVVFVIIAVVVTLAAVSLYIKMERVRSSRNMVLGHEFLGFAHQVSSGPRSWYLAHPRTFYGLSDYANLTDIREIGPVESGKNGEIFVSEIRFEIDESPFGEIKSCFSGHLPVGGWVLTNVYRFMWNTICVDGLCIKNPDEIRGHGPKLVFFRGSGTSNIRAMFDPPSSYLIMRKISLGLFFPNIVIILFIWMVKVIRIGRAGFCSLARQLRVQGEHIPN